MSKRVLIFVFSIFIFFTAQGRTCHDQAIAGLDKKLDKVIEKLEPEYVKLKKVKNSIKKYNIMGYSADGIFIASLALFIINGSLLGLELIFLLLKKEDRKIMFGVILELLKMSPKESYAFIKRFLRRHKYLKWLISSQVIIGGVAFGTALICLITRFYCKYKKSVINKEKDEYDKEISELLYIKNNINRRKFEIQEKYFTSSEKLNDSFDNCTEYLHENNFYNNHNAYFPK